MLDSNDFIIFSKLLDTIDFILYLVSIFNVK